MAQNISSAYRTGVTPKKFSIPFDVIIFIALFWLLAPPVALRLYAMTYQDKVAQLVLNQEQGHLSNWLAKQCPQSNFQVLRSDMQFDDKLLNQPGSLDLVVDFFTSYRQTGITHVTIGSPDCNMTETMTASWNVMVNRSFFESSTQPYIRVDVGEVEKSTVKIGAFSRAIVRDAPLTEAEMPAVEPGQPGPGTVEYNRRMVEMARQRALAEQAKALADKATHAQH